MSDMQDWINERRNIHDAATEGPWSVVDEQELVGAKDGWPEYLLEGVAEGCEGFVRDRRDAAAIVDAHNTRPNLLDALGKVLELHTRVVTDQHIDGPTAVCEQCSEDRMFALWPCLTVRAVQSAIEGASNE